MTTAVFFLVLAFYCEYRADRLEKRGYEGRSLFMSFLSLISFIIASIIVVFMEWLFN